VLRCRGAVIAIVAGVIDTEPVFNMLVESFLERIAMDNGCELARNAGHVYLLPTIINAAPSTYIILVAHGVIKDQIGARFTKGYSDFQRAL